MSASAPAPAPAAVVESAHVSAITNVPLDAAWKPMVPVGHSDYTWGRLGQAYEARVRAGKAAKDAKKGGSKAQPAAAAAAAAPKKEKAAPKDKSASSTAPPPDVPAPGPPVCLGQELASNGPILPVDDRRNILITSALPYVNNVPHLGNLIGCCLSADVYARFCRLRGHNTLFVCGTDEYGTATERKALEEGLTPKEICDKYHAIHAKIYDWFNIRFDQFGRTTTEKQTEIAQDIYLQLEKNGWSSEKPTKELYCESHRKFLADRFVEGICPKSGCGYVDARGDQCDACGQTLDAIELIEPMCKLCKEAKTLDPSYIITPPKIVESKHLFLDLEKLQPELTSWIDRMKVEGDWNENAIQITNGQLNAGLKSRPITKDLKWGTPVPKVGYENKVFYVWFDAPIGYISITANYTQEWKKWWKNPNKVNLVQFMGKDNIPFHTVMFPATLMAADKDYTLLHHVSCTEYLNYEGTKFSKSRNTGVFGDDAMETGIPSEVWRYYLLFNRPEQADTVFLWEDFASKCNTELLNNLGNFINRTLSFLYTKCGNVVPACGALTPADEVMIREVSELKSNYITALEKVKIKDGLRAVMAISGRANQYMQDNKPWEAFKTDRQRCDTILYLSVNLISTLSILLEPYMPSLTEKINGQLNQRLLASSALDAYNGNNATSNQFNFTIPTGHILGVPTPLFRRIDDEEVASLRLRFGGQPVEKKKGEPFPLQLIVGTVTEAQDHPSAPHLFVIQLQTDEPASVAESQKLTRPGFRQIVAGLRPNYDPSTLVGRRFVVLTNLKPSNFKSIRSEGMLLTAVKGATTRLLTLGEVDGDSASVPNGAAILPRDCILQLPKSSFDPKKELSKLDMLTRGENGIVYFGSAPLEVQLDQQQKTIQIVGDKAGEGAKIQ